MSISFIGGVGGGGSIVSVNGRTGVVSLSATDVTAAAATHVSSHQITGSDPLVPVTVTAALSATNTNDWNPGPTDVVYLSNLTTANINITGMATAASNIYRLIVNISTHTAASITIKHQNTNSTAVNQFAVPWLGDYVMSANGGAAGCLRAGDNSRWRLI